MTCTITRKKDQKESVWSGGKTRELFIYPAYSSYSGRNFSVRISSATVEEDPSVFTSLSGFHRILMPLSGTMKLTFDGRKEALIKPYEPVEFEGGWNTVSFGKCTDIGIMLSHGWTGSLSAAGPGEYKYKEGFIGVYALSDSTDVSVKTRGENFPVSLGQGDFLLVKTDEGEITLTLSTTRPYGAVIARAWPVI